MSGNPRPSNDAPFVPAISSATDGIDALLEQGILAEPPHPGIRACFKRFQVLRCLGEGGIGVVLLAHDPQSGRYVALKLPRPELRQSQDGIDRFRREAELLEKITLLHHEHILPVHEIAAPDEPPYLVMPFIEGGSLAERIHLKGPLDDASALRIAIDVGRALVETHRRVIYHRDIKPENVLLDAHERALLADFNLAFDGSAVGSIELDVSRIAGTAPYLAPEVASGDQQGDARSDVYGLGCLLYTMLTGQPPFSGKTDREIIQQVRVGKPSVPIRQLNSRLGRELARSAEKAMSRDPRDRYAEMRLFVDDLERIALGAEPASGQSKPRGQWSVGCAVQITLATLVVALGISLWFALSPGKPGNLTNSPIAQAPAEHEGGGTPSDGLHPEIVENAGSKKHEPVTQVADEPPDDEKPDEEKGEDKDKAELRRRALSPEVLNLLLPLTTPDHKQPTQILGLFATGETTVKKEGVSLTRLRSLGVLDENERGMTKLAILNSTTWTNRPRWPMKYEAPEPNLWSDGQRDMIITMQKYLKEYGHILVEEGLLAP